MHLREDRNGPLACTALTRPIIDARYRRQKCDPLPHPAVAQRSSPTTIPPYPTRRRAPVEGSCRFLFGCCALLSHVRARSLLSCCERVSAPRTLERSGLPCASDLALVGVLVGSSQGHADLLLAFFGGGGWLLRLLFDEVDTDADQCKDQQPADCGRGQARKRRKLSKAAQRCGRWVGER